MLLYYVPVTSVRMNSEPQTAGPNSAIVEKRIEAVTELARGMETGLLLPTLPALATTQVRFTRNVLIHECLIKSIFISKTLKTNQLLQFHTS